MQKNKVQEAWETRGVAVGTWVTMKSTEICELAAAVGFDFVIIDGEHGSFGIESAIEMIRAIESRGGAAPILRLPDGSSAGINTALDAGAAGILIPHIHTGEEAAQIVRSAKHPPSGSRGCAGLIRATSHGVIGWKEYTEWCEQNTLVWIQVEDIDAIKNIDSILSSGVDAVLVGLFDLSMSMGLKGDVYHPDIVEVCNHVSQVAARKGVDMIDILPEIDSEELLESARAWKKKGHRALTVITDHKCLLNCYRKFLTNFREL